MEVGVKDTIGPLDQDALQHGSMMPDGWQAEIEPPNDRDERESANDALCRPAGSGRGAQGNEPKNL